MAKDTYYFSHDYNARQDEKIKRLLRKYKCAGYGIYWCLVEDLYNNANVLELDYEGIAFDLHEDIKMVESVINDFGLFVITNKEFGSSSIERRLDERNEKSKKAQKSAFKRWNKYKDDANALQTHYDSNAINKEKKDNIEIEINSQNFSSIDEYREYREQIFTNLDEDFKKALNEKVGIDRPIVWCNRKLPQGYYDLVDCLIKVKDDVEWRSSIQINNNIDKTKFLRLLYEFTKEIKDSTTFMNYDGYDGADGKDNFKGHFVYWIKCKLKK